MPPPLCLLHSEWEPPVFPDLSCALSDRDITTESRNCVAARLSGKKCLPIFAAGYSRMRLLSYPRERMKMDRIEREKRVVSRMIGLYCRAHHDTDGTTLCPSCSDLRAYALRRLERCRFGAEKPPCECCPIHCYAPAFRERIRAVMRYAGPRMLIHAPLDALWHLLRRLRQRR